MTVYQYKVHIQRTVKTKKESIVSNILWTEVLSNEEIIKRCLKGSKIDNSGWQIVKQEPIQRLGLKNGITFKNKL